jgi:hypothetical protein
MVNVCLGATLLLYLIFVPYSINNLDDYLCNFKQFKQTGEISIFGNFLLIFFSFIQMTSCLLIPYAFYNSAKVDNLEE